MSAAAQTSQTRCQYLQFWVAATLLFQYSIYFLTANVNHSAPRSDSEATDTAGQNDIRKIDLRLKRVEKKTVQRQEAALCHKYPKDSSKFTLHALNASNE